MKLAVRNAKGKKVGEVELSSAIFEAKVNDTAVAQTYRAQMAMARAGTASTKGRAEVRGGGRKPWRQKGTGRARAGSIRSPLWAGGGTVFGPKPRGYTFPVPKKVRRLAVKSVLSAKAKDGELIVVDWKPGEDEAKTKIAAEVLSNIGAPVSTTIVIDEAGDLIERAARNIAGVKVVRVSSLNVRDLLNNEGIVITRAALDKMQEVLAE